MSSGLLSLAGDVQAVTLANKRFVILPESEYVRLRSLAGEDEPPMPSPDAHGNYPAVEALRVSIARSILRHRRALGLTQADLARRAGIRPETLNRIEKAQHSPSVPTVERIDRALRAVEAELAVERASRKTAAQARGRGGRKGVKSRQTRGRRR
jgi:DNA-binding XRE family transcriptional regulator